MPIAQRGRELARSPSSQGENSPPPQKAPQVKNPAPFQNPSPVQNIPPVRNYTSVQKSAPAQNPTLVQKTVNKARPGDSWHAPVRATQGPIAPRGRELARSPSSQGENSPPPQKSPQVQNAAPVQNCISVPNVVNQARPGDGWQASVRATQGPIAQPRRELARSSSNQSETSPPGQKSPPVQSYIPVEKTLSLNNINSSAEAIESSSKAYNVAQTSPSTRLLHNKCQPNEYNQQSSKTKALPSASGRVANVVGLVERNPIDEISVPFTSNGNTNTMSIQSIPTYNGGSEQIAPMRPRVRIPAAAPFPASSTKLSEQQVKPAQNPWMSSTIRQAPPHMRARVGLNRGRYIDGDYKSVNRNAGAPVPGLNGGDWGFAQTRDGRGIVA